MKIRLKILVFFIATLSISCSKDEDSPVVETFDMFGNWALTDYHFEGSQRTLSEISNTTITFSATAWDIGVSAIFSKTPNDYSNIGEYNLDATVVDENGQEFYFPSHREFNDIGSWNRTGNFLGFTIDGEITQAKISVLSETTLEYLVNSSRSFYDENNDLITILRSDFYTYTRVDSN
jgi:mannose-1-phosphate guanylyltransferase